MTNVPKVANPTEVPPKAEDCARRSEILDSLDQAATEGARCGLHVTFLERRATDLIEAEIRVAGRSPARAGALIFGAWEDRFFRPSRDVKDRLIETAVAHAQETVEERTARRRREILSDQEHDDLERTVGLERLLDVRERETALKELGRELSAYDRERLLHGETLEPLPPLETDEDQVESEPDPSADSVPAVDDESVEAASEPLDGPRVDGEDEIENADTLEGPSSPSELDPTSSFLVWLRKQEARAFPANGSVPSDRVFKRAVAGIFVGDVHSKPLAFDGTDAPEGWATLLVSTKALERFAREEAAAGRFAPSLRLGDLRDLAPQLGVEPDSIAPAKGGGFQARVKDERRPVRFARIPRAKSTKERTR